MFESVLRRSYLPRTPFGLRAALSAGAHCCALGALVWLSMGHAEEKPDAPEVTFFSPTGTGAAGKPALQQGNPDSVEKVKRPDPKRRDTFVHNAGPAPASTSARDPYGDEDGSPDGDPNGSADGTAGAGSPTGTEIADPVPPDPQPEPKPEVKPPPKPPPPRTLTSKMTSPHKISGPDPVYSREAREARVEGVVMAQCTIELSGRLSGCTIVKSLPFMDQVVLSALAKQRWEPPKEDGKPVSVVTVFPFRFKLKK